MGHFDISYTVVPVIRFFLCVTEVRKQVEVDRFLSDLRKGMMEAGSNLTQEQCMPVCE